MQKNAPTRRMASSIVVIDHVSNENLCDKLSLPSCEMDDADELGFGFTAENEDNEE